MSRRRWMPAALVPLLALACAPALAQADRAPNRAELSGVAQAAKVPARCLKVRISTVDTSYASAYRRNLKPSCRRWQADGVGVFKHASGRWRLVTSGSSFSCPVPKVPRKVARDLQIRCYKEG